MSAIEKLPTTIDGYFATFGKYHVEKSVALLQPLHLPGADSLPNFDRYLRQPFEAQAHVVAAMIAALDESHSCVLAAEMGCIAGESEVYDPVAKVYRRVDQIKEPFHVVSHHEGKMVVGRALKPFIKGRKKLYRVWLSDGRSFVATDDHLVLGQASHPEFPGWKTDLTWWCVGVVAELLQQSFAFHLPSTPAPFPSASPRDAGHSSRTPSGSTDRCSTDHRPCGEPPRSASDAGRGPAPPPGDVPEPDRGCSRTDDPADRSARTRAYLRSGRHSKSGSALLIGHTILSGASAPLLSSGPDGPGGSPFRDDPQFAGESLQPDTTVSCPPPDTRTDAPWLCTPSEMGEMVHVTGIVYERTDAYYDFTVEEHHNYVMSGVVHHNTGKTIQGMLAVDLHARRSRRKGGSNGRYRSIVLCPDHLIYKWKDEIERTIPDANVTTFDVQGGGCKQLIKDMIALYDRCRGKGGRWLEPEGPEWFILGRDQSKLMPGVSPLGSPRRGEGNQGFEHGSSVRRISRFKDEEGKPQQEIVREYRCPRCGTPVDDMTNSSKMFVCERIYGIEIPDPAVRSPSETGLEVWYPPVREKSKLRPGMILHRHGDGKKYLLRACGEPLWQYVAEPRRWAPAIFLAKKMPRLFDYLVADEIHQQKGKATAQANAFGMLAANSRNVLALTGTLIGGYARDVFYLLLRTDARPLLTEGFRWGSDMAFTRAYGRIETIETTKTNPDGTSTISRSRKSLAKDEEKSETERPAPGIMPALFGRHLIGRAVFLALDDMADNLPALREYVGGPPEDDYTEEDHEFWHECAIDMSPELHEEYKRVEGLLAAKCTELLQHGSMKLLGQLLVATLGYPDLPFGWKAPTGVEEHLACGYWDLPKLRTPKNWVGVVQPRDLPEDITYPKEEALLEIVEKEVIAGNQVWIYVQMSDKRDVRPRLAKLLKERGMDVEILRSGGKGGPKPKDRLAWIEEKGKGANVIISHPQLVETGIDFFKIDQAGGYAHNFNAIIFYETGYNIFTLRQAARRAWRIGQKRNCRVYYLYYQGTGQRRAMDLIARKMGAALALDGELSVEGLASMTDDTSAAMALARSISENIEDVDIGRNWAKVGARPAPKIAAGELPEEFGELIEGIDILSMEAELLSETLLEYDSSSPTIDPSQLAAMYEEVFGDWDPEDFEDLELDPDDAMATCE